MERPAFYRARVEVIKDLLVLAHKRLQESELPEEEKKKDKEIRLLRNAYISADYDEKELVALKLATGDFVDTPLKFTELCTYNTWFNLHPEKVAGEEKVTTSREFPLTIKGTKEDIINTIKNSIAMRREKGNIKLKAKALKLRLKLLEQSFSGVNNAELNGLEGLGELGDLVMSEVTANSDAVKKLVSDSEKEREYKATDKLSFDEVFKAYNKGLTDVEIKAWVWYKRSIGIPMTIWEKYFLPNRGEAEEKVITIKKTLIKDNHFRDIIEVGSGIYLGKPTRFSNEYGGTTWMIFTAHNGDKQYVSSKDVKIEKSEMKTDLLLLDDLVKNGGLFYVNGNLFPYPIFSYGNMYDRELQLEKDKEAILESYGEEVYNNHKAIIQKAKPELLSIFNPDTTMRPKILAISDFAYEFKIRELREDLNIELPPKNDDYALSEAFFFFLKSLGRNDFKVSTPFDIWNYYILGKKITDKDLEEDQRRELKANARNEGEEIFSRFLNEGLTFSDQEKLNISWNRIYNAQSSIAYHQIPIGFECSAKFKQFNLHFTPIQREGIAFMEAVGSGIIAYDVGVGKTMTAILTLAQAIYSGKASRPLVVVPNPTYGKWIKEIIGYTDKRTNQFVPGVLSNTKIRLNEWYNLGTDSLKKIKGNQKIPANTITLVTYEGFKKIGFSEKVMEDMFVELTNILYQSKADKSERDVELDYQKYREKIGVGVKGTEVDIDTLGIDYIVIDEAHRCKNVFEGVKADEDGKKRFGITSAVSETGIKAFFLCNYIQRTYGRNVMLLTATPFTNSPLEIYSMLSLVAYEGMKKLGIYNLLHFFELFVQERTEFVVNYKEQIVPKDVVKSYNNRLLLQKLIYNHINYKTGEEAGVKRPCKINLPRVNTVDKGNVKRLTPDKQILTYLKMTPAQRENQNAITALAKAATIGRPNMAALFRALNYSLDNALSPFLYAHGGKPEDYKEFVEESPKIKYIMDCIRSVKSWHEARKEPVSGQVIYLNRGKDYFPMIQQYLENEIGYQRGVKWNNMRVNEVEIITSELSQIKKENVKEAFLDGAVKIIIGTATIREGIDLQKKGTVIYNAYPDWNPTDIRQLEGRIWRQGNEFGYVRSVMPLVQDSMDVFVFQKLEEKTARINDIWYRGDRGNVLDLESLDPEEVKFALLSDLDIITRMKIKMVRAEAERRLQSMLSNLDTLSKFDATLRRYFVLRENCIAHLERAKQLILGMDYSHSYYQSKNEEDLKSIQESNGAVIKAIQDYQESSPQEDKELLRIGRMLDKNEVPISAKNAFLFSEFKQYLSHVKKAEKTILAQKGYTLNDNMQDIIKAFKEEKDKIVEEITKINSPEYFESVKQEVREKKSAMAITGATVEERAMEFAKLNYLLSYRSSEVAGDNCLLPEGESAIKKTNTGNIFRLKLKAKALKLKLKLLQAA